MNRMHKMPLLVLVGTVVFGGVAYGAASWYWRSGSYVLPRYNQTVALQEILTDHRNRLDSLNAVQANLIAAAHVNGSPGTPSVTRFTTPNLPGSPTVTVSRVGGFPVGTYVVDFGASVTGRYYNVVQGNATSGVPASGFCDVTPAIGNPNGLYIRIWSAPGTRVDTDFYVEIW